MEPKNSWHRAGSRQGKMTRVGGAVVVVVVVVVVAGGAGVVVLVVVVIEGTTQ